MEKVPMEIWTQIFVSACIDGGSTGRALSLVSKFFYEASQTIKLQSIALQGKDEILAFASLLTKTPSTFRRVRYLFISSHDPKRPHEENLIFREDVSWLALPNEVDPTLSPWTVERETVPLLVQAISQILEFVAPTVQILSLSTLLHVSAPPLTLPHAFPSLIDLTFCTGGGLEYQGSRSLPSLQRLHIANCSNIETVNHLSCAAPALTHLRVSAVGRFMAARLMRELGIGDGALTGFTRRCPMVKTIVVQPDILPVGRAAPLQMQYQRMVEELAELSNAHRQLVVIDAERRHCDPFSNCEEFLKDWLDICDGGRGCWLVEEM